MLGRETVPLFYDFKHYKEYTVISQHTEAFIEKNIHCRYYKRYTDIREADWDALVVGSDQIWRRNFNQKIENVFFDFAWDPEKCETDCLCSFFRTGYLGIFRC
ncbi:hypothetical protein NXX09_17000 [Bacteroides uniformis]|nr:hypothetical protein [Bacteroides uniformis]